MAVTTTSPEKDVTLLILAREIAMEIQDVDKILEVHKVSAEEFEQIRRTPRFLQYLEGAIQEWNSALNTHERVKIKAAYLLEEWLTELNARLHDKDESLAAKIEGGKFAARLAGMGLTGANIEGAAGERIVVNINLGADSKLTFEKQLPAPKIIEAEPVRNGN